MRPVLRVSGEYNDFVGDGRYNRLQVGVLRDRGALRAGDAERKPGGRAEAPLYVGVAVLLAIVASSAFAANPAVDAAVAALQRQDFQAAEVKLRAEVKTHPANAEALSLLGVALDEQQKFIDGRIFHKRAMAAAPRSTAVLYNYANNLLATGDV